ncbi:interleukin-13 receptor subunit alpha-2 isoform X2 [Cyclopterus lumpus]|uniref:interleukin-13 receptor subunit alpha-2 isoform X2 n=1 Tax=Cyclopterus lumpus TaxID=8103 RepID=UPI0014865808|nr:interleukin-13 receptor subunit alpha-2 isoform X2 [Cyclopterus lumpus]
MASKSWMTLMLLLLITWPESTSCDGQTDPPEDLVISDLGHLGHLQIRWSPPASFMNMTECSKLYQLEYFNTYKNSWTAIRTVQPEHLAQFDLMKEVRVRVYTLLTGPCIGGTMVKSTRYTELVQKPSSTGVAGTAVQDFVCVYHNRQYLECNWGGNPKMPANSRQNLYFWHKGLKQADECPKYLISDGTRSGCNFTGNSLPEFSDINFCINGSSPEGPLKTTFFSLQIQNKMKLETTEELHLETGPGKQLKLHWEAPVWNSPGHCLEWEVEHKQEGPNGKIATISTKQMSLTLPFEHDSQRNCFRVRSKVNKYCAERSFWSEWSRPICHPENKEVAPEPGWDMVPIYVYIAVAITAILVLSLCVGLVFRRISRRVKKPDSLLTNLFTRNAVGSAREA